MQPQYGKARAVGISLALHGCAFQALMYSPSAATFTLPPASPSEYQQAFAGKEDKIVWYKFREMPNISPDAATHKRAPLRADVEAKQALISSPKNAPRREQVVVTPLPSMELPDVDLPNLIAVRLPPRPFVAPVPATAPGAHAIAPPSEAPKYEGRPDPTRLPAVRLPSRAYVPPPAQPVEARRQVEAVSEAPSMALNSPSETIVPKVRLPARAYAPPPAAAVPEKPTIVAPQAADATIVIAGLKPATTDVKLPAASSPAQFAAGPKLLAEGANAEGAGKDVTEPDLFAHSATETKPDLLAMTLAAPTSKAFVDATLNHRPTATFTANASTRVSNAPDPRFNGRDVYMMAIQMSNLTSYSGSWLMWYSDHNAKQTGAPPVAAPVPHRKVDPKYTPSAIEAHVEGRVQLFCVIGKEGFVSAIELLRGVDERLNRSAEEALSKWEFYPATRNGEPVDVDVVVEIPFVLAPPPLK